MTLVDIAARLGYASHGAATYAIRAAQIRNGANIVHYGQDAPARTMVGWAYRNFGLEIEHNGCSLNATARAIRDAGLPCQNSGYTHRVTSDWKAVHDGSCGNEAVSPILSGTEGFAQVSAVMRALTAAGGRVDRRCGMHVHIDMAGLTGEQIARFVALYVHHQADIDNLMPPSRVGNYYARTIAESELVTITDAFRTAGTTPSNWSQDRRYKTLNVMAFPKYGTMEVRQHQGTLNPQKARAWVLFLLAMVEVARLDRCEDVAFGADFVKTVCQIAGGVPRQVVRRLEDRRRSQRDTTPDVLPDYSFGADNDEPESNFPDHSFGNACGCDECARVQRARRLEAHLARQVRA